MATGRFDDGLSALAEALTAADEHKIRHYEAEMHRLKGELLLKQSNSKASDAQSCFQRAIAVARKQSGKSLELRATMSLSRLLDKQGRRDEARAMLAGRQGAAGRISRIATGAGGACAVQNAGRIIGKGGSFARNAGRR